MNTIFDEEIKLIKDALSSIDTKIFHNLVDNCVQAIKCTGKIVATGLGKNVPLCEKFVGTMVSMDMPAVFMHTNSAIHGDLGLIKQNDLVLMLSKSGETAESVILSKYLIARGCRIWLLTFKPESTCGKLIKNQLIVSLTHEGDPWNIVPNNSSIVNLIILQSLCMRMAYSLGIRLDDFRKNHPGGHIGELLK